MTKQEIIDLNISVDSLINVMEQLKSENHFLREKLTNMTKERADLISKKNRAMNELKRIVKQLKQLNVHLVPKRASTT